MDDKHDDLPIKHCDFLCYVRSPEGNAQTRNEYKQVHSGMIPLSFLHVFGDLDEWGHNNKPNVFPYVIQ